MATRSSRSPITDDLLETLVRIKRESGVALTEIQAVVARFASQEQWRERTGGIGFPIIEDIPQSGRGAFMAALAELTPDPERADKGRRWVSAADIWPSRIV